MVTAKSITPMLMFTGRAAEAVELYTEVFGDSVVEELDRYGADDPAGAEGTVRHATFVVGGLRLSCIDSPPMHEFTFTPSMSLVVDCATADEVDAVVDRLGQDGGLLMPLGPYPFSPRFAWISDRFGVTWQIGVLSASRNAPADQ